MARRQVGGRAARRREPIPIAGLWRALGLTVASAVVWGVAHVSAGRRLAGFTLMSLLALLVAGTATVALAFQDRLKQVIVQNFWLDAITAGILVLALVWASVVIRSYQVVRPAGLPAAMRVASGSLVVIMALLVCTPFVYAANTTYVLRNTLSNIFPGDHSGPAIDASDPWKNLPRLNVLLLGGDGGKDRTGIRTDSMTVASIDTHTGNTVLFGLPRNMQYFAMPPRLDSIYPSGYRPAKGSGYDGLLNEIYQLAEQDPRLEPGYKKGQRGPHLMEEVIGNLLGLKINYYVLVNLGGFKDIVDAMGGVTVHIEKRLPIGGEIANGHYTRLPTGYLDPGTRKLDGEQALWYGRSRDADSDYYRMDRQKCLLKDIADQADPQRIVTHFQALARAATNTIYTNLPSALLPALVKLSGTFKHGGDVRSVAFTPNQFPNIQLYPPDVTFLRQETAKAIAASEHPQPSTPGANATPKRHKKKTLTAASGTTTSTPKSPATGSTGLSLKNACG